MTIAWARGKTCNSIPDCESGVAGRQFTAMAPRRIETARKQNETLCKRRLRAIFGRALRQMRGEFAPLSGEGGFGTGSGWLPGLDLPSV